MFEAMYCLKQICQSCPVIRNMSFMASSNKLTISLNNYLIAKIYFDDFDKYGNCYYINVEVTNPRLGVIDSIQFDLVKLYGLEEKYTNIVARRSYNGLIAYSHAITSTPEILSESLLDHKHAGELISDYLELFLEPSEEVKENGWQRITFIEEK